MAHAKALTLCCLVVLCGAYVPACTPFRRAGLKTSSHAITETIRMKTDPIPELTECPPRRVGLLVEPTPFTHVSGYSNRYKEMIRYLVKAGDKLHIVTPDDSPDRPTEHQGQPVSSWKGWKFPLYPEVMLSFDWRFRTYQIMKKFRPEIIHLSMPGVLVFMAIFISRVLRVPLVMSYHTHMTHYAHRYGYGFMAGVSDLWIRAMLNRADLVLATSPQLRDELKNIGVRRVQVWQKGIDCQVFSPKYNIDNQAMRARMSDGDVDAPLLLYVGRLGVEKNIKLLKPVLEKVPGARLALVGGGPQEEELRKHFKGTKTKFVGLLRGEELSRAYAAADVFVMPSESETLGFVAMEAMASGVPPVCAAAGGLKNLVDDGKTGLLAEPGNAEDFAVKVRSILGDKQYMEELSQQAREEALRWDWQAATSVLRNRQYVEAQRGMNDRWFFRKKKQASIWFRFFGNKGKDAVAKKQFPSQANAV